MIGSLQDLFDAASLSLVERFGWLLIHSLWQVTLVAIAAALILSVCRHRSANTRYLLLLFGLAVIAICPIATWNFHSSAVRTTTTQVVGTDPSHQGESTALSSSEPVAPTTLTDPLPRQENYVSDTSSALQYSLNKRLRPWMSTIVAFWAIGALCFAMRPAVGWITVRRLRLEGTSVVAESVQHLLARTSEAIGLHRAVGILQSSMVTSPIVIGWLKPVVLLPVSIISGLSPEQLQAVLAHELAHVRRQDYIVNVVQTIVESVFFYHPAVWWISNRIRIEREYCCDDIAVNALSNHHNLGRALLATAELRGSSNVLALGIKDGPILGRIKRLMGHPVASDSPIGSLFALSTLIAVVLGFSLYSPAYSTPKLPPVAAKAQDENSANTESAAEVAKRIDSLLMIASSRHEEGNIGAAKAALSKARVLAEKLPPDDPTSKDFNTHFYVQSGAILSLTWKIAEIEGPHAAVDIAGLASAPHYKAMTLSHVAGMMPSNDPEAVAILQRGLVVARQVTKIPHPLALSYPDPQTNQESAFEAVIVGFAEIDQLDQALKVVAELSSRLKPPACWSSLHSLLKMQILAADDAGRDKVLKVIKTFDADAPANGEDEPMFGKPLILGATFDAAEILITKKEWRRVDKLLRKIRSQDPEFLQNYQLDSVLTRVALIRLADTDDNYQSPPETRFHSRQQYLFFAALHARLLAQNNKESQAERILDEVVAGVESLPEGNRPRSADTLGFVAQTFAMLGNDERAMEIANMISRERIWYIPTQQFEFYNLEYQAMPSRSTTLALIARAQLKDYRPDDAIRTLANIKLEKNNDGTAKHWYPEKVLAHSLAEIATELLMQGDTLKAKRLVESAPTAEIKRMVEASLH